MGAIIISRELNRLGVKPRKGDRWKATRVLKMICKPLYAGLIRWGGETAEGVHEAIISRETFDAAHETMHGRAQKGRSLRSPNVPSGLVRCGICGAPMHVTYPGIEPKSRYRYYACNNRLNHKSCEQDYIRADLLEGSVLAEIGKLARRREGVSELVREFANQNRDRKLPELEARREAMRAESGRVRKEREKLTRWVLSSTPTPQGVAYLNQDVDGLAEAEGGAQERPWSLEDEINGLQTATYNAVTVCERMADVVRTFPTLDAGERKLWAESWIAGVEVRKKEAVVVLTPPLCSLGFLYPSPATRGEKPQAPELRIRVEYDLSAYYPGGVLGGARARYSLAPESGGCGLPEQAPVAIRIFRSGGS